MVITEREKNKIIEAIEATISMKQACLKLGYSRSEFKNRAKQLGLWSPARPGDIEPANKLSKEDLILGNTTRHSHGLKKRLIDEGLLVDKCNKCGWGKKREWSKYSSCHLHHKDGDEHNNRLENLELLCPNCHSLTDGYCIPKNPSNQHLRALVSG